MFEFIEKLQIEQYDNLTLSKQIQAELVKVKKPVKHEHPDENLQALTPRALFNLFFISGSTVDEPSWKEIRSCFCFLEISKYISCIQT